LDVFQRQFHDNVHRETMMIHSKLGTGATAFIAAAGLAVSAQAAETTITAVNALQITNTQTQSFLKTFVAPVNAKGKGVVQIKFLGAQEIVPPRKAAKALQRGQFGMLGSPTSYYLGLVPEGRALLVANQGPHVLRQNGGWELLQSIYKKRARAHLLAWGNNRVSYLTYLAKMPKLDKDGVPDLTGVKMRATGTYRPLFRALGASTINIKSSEVYTAMQRGTVGGFGFPAVGSVPNGFHKVANYRITPMYYQSNDVVTVNLDVWDGLTRAQKDFLTKEAMEFERESVKFVQRNWEKEEKIMMTEGGTDGKGVKDLALKGKAAEKYLQIAYEEVWKVFKEKSPEHYEELRKLLYVEGKPNRLPLR
jgi:TRAP-type C4-dicarboxylate transport system substrate-binding protein